MPPAPPKNKLYPKTGKLKTINNARGPPNTFSNNVPSTSSASPPADTEAERQLELELCWCIQTMETSINSGKLNAKQAQDTDRTIKILKSATQPVIKKRQVMRAAFGDYRALMAEEERKLRLKNQQIQFTPKAPTSAFFVKKSALLASASDFRFNFPVVANLQQLDLNKTNEDDASANDSSVEACPSTGKTVQHHEPKAPPSTIVSSDNTFRFNFSVDKD